MAYMGERIANEWKPWFAWYPVKLLSGETVWLETVRRRSSWAWRFGVKWDYKEAA